MTGLAPQWMMLAAVVLYGLPALVAVALGRRRQWEIVALDLLLGWTGIGWIAALVWAVRKPRPPKPKPFAPEPADPTDELALADAALAEELPPLDPYADWLNQGGGLEEPEGGAAAGHTPRLSAPGSAAA